ncbi:MAG: type IV secretory system conjugative DNA transfer family protein [Burkholderiales bacterium]
MQENKWVKVIAIGVVMPIVVLGLAMYIAGYFYLWHIGVSPMSTKLITWLQYWMYYGDQKGVRLQLIVCMVMALGLVVPPAVVVALPKKRKLHGDAKFATEREIKEAGLLGENGIIIGAWDTFFGFSRKYIMLGGQLGVMLAAPPRSGKGAGVVNTNMLNWPGSVVALDIRQESWRVTSGYRKAHGQACFLFNPVAEDRMTCQWNPMSYVNDDPILIVNDLQKIADMLSPTPAEGDPFWPSSCRMLFVGVALYVFETEGLMRSIGEIVRQVMEKDGKHWEAILEERHLSGKPLSSACDKLMRDYIYLSENTQSSIKKTFTSKLELWLNPLVDTATSADSFDLRDLRKKRISIYIGILPGDIKRVSLITNLLFQQIVDLNTREMPEDNPALVHQLLLMMDEFTSMGKMMVFEAAVSYLGGYNIRPCIVIQGPSQLRQTYGQEGAQTITDCLGAQIIFAPKEEKHAKEISEALGYETVKDFSFSKSKGIDFKQPQSMGSVSTNEKARALLLPQEVKEIGKLKEIIFIENVRPIMCAKIRYFKDPVFKKRLMPPVRMNPIVVVPHKNQWVPKKQVEQEDGPYEIIAGQKVRMVDVTAEHLKNMDEFSLKDFNGRFDEVVLPAGDPPSVEEMDTAVNSFLSSLEAAA